MYSHLPLLQMDEGWLWGDETVATTEKGFSLVLPHEPHSSLRDHERPYNSWRSSVDRVPPVRMQCRGHSQTSLWSFSIFRIGRGQCHVTRGKTVTISVVFYNSWKWFYYLFSKMFIHHLFCLAASLVNIGKKVFICTIQQTMDSP